MQAMKKRGDAGFTLVELMTVMAIIAILATSIIMSLSSHKKRAEGSKALTELSAVMQNIYLCIADDGMPTNPADNQPICSGLTNSNAYGFWPDLSSCALASFNYDGLHGTFTSAWGYSVRSIANSTLICCNSTSARCEKFDTIVACDQNTQLK